MLDGKLKGMSAYHVFIVRISFSGISFCKDVYVYSFFRPRFYSLYCPDSQSQTSQSY